MWFERFVIIVISLYQDYLPSAWRIYKPTIVDYGILLGSFGFFFTLVLLFARVLPVIATSEMKPTCPAPSPGMERTMNESFAVLGLFDSADALMQAVPGQGHELSSVLAASPRNFRCMSGCPTPWKVRRLFPH